MQIAELEHLLPSSGHSAPNYIDYYPVEKANMPAKGLTAHPDKALTSVENEDSDTNLRLGYIAFVFRISIYVATLPSFWINRVFSTLY